jgi:type VI secretion system secreted protein VgrG
MADELNIKLEIAGDDSTLRVLRFAGREEISQLFSFEIDFIIEDSDGLPDSIAPGAAASLVLSRGNEEVRAVRGILRRLDVNLDGAGTVSYRAVLVPRAWRARLVRQQRIFLDASIIDVARTKLKSVGVTGDDIVENTLSQYPAREFIVQYQEDDMDFISRLTEWAGVAFYIDHQLDKDRMVFVDHVAGFPEHDGEPLTMSNRIDEPNRVQELTSQHHMSQGLAMVYDYNYRTPDVTLKAVKKIASGHGGGTLEYPSHVKTADEATELATIRAEEIAVHQKPYNGRSNIVELRAGLRIPFSGNEQLAAADLLITSVDHVAEPVDGSPDQVSYTNRFTAVRADMPFRPRRVTPRPQINGILTAVVQGTGSDTGRRAIIDEHGRYVVQFHFDQALGNLHLKASRAVRMSQSFTGSSEGMHFPLKPGVEVAVAFMDGDPDRPVIVGALPNHTQPSVVTASNATVNKIATDNGITIQFGKLS